MKQKHTKNLWLQQKRVLVSSACWDINGFHSVLIHASKYTFKHGDLDL